jgi:hypothetical protein
VVIQREIGRGEKGLHVGLSLLFSTVCAKGNGRAWQRPQMNRGGVMLLEGRLSGTGGCKDCGCKTATVTCQTRASRGAVPWVDLRATVCNQMGSVARFAGHDETRASKSASGRNVGRLANRASASRPASVGPSATETLSPFAPRLLFFFAAPTPRPNSSRNSDS